LAEGEIHFKVLFFGSAAEICGCSETTQSMSIGSSVDALLNNLSVDYPEFASLQKHCAVAINTKLCSSSTELYDDCTVAILPPVSGG